VLVITPNHLHKTPSALGSFDLPLDGQADY